MALTLAEKTQLCALAADSRKAEDIVVLDVQPVVLGGRSFSHLQRFLGPSGARHR